jgi:DNA-binding transcriptional LysR family regulator
VTAFPDSLVRHNAVRWNLKVLPVALGGPLPVAAFTLKSRTRNRAIQAFIAAAREASRDGAGQAHQS